MIKIMLQNVIWTKGLHLPNHLQSLMLRPNVFGKIFAQLRSSYIVLLPELPEETAETNPLLRDSVLPDFSELTAQNCYNGIGKYCLDYESRIWKLEEGIKDGSIPKTFTNIIDELHKLDAPLSYAWNTVKTLYSVKNDELNTANYLKIHERARQARGYKFQSKLISDACKEIHMKESLSELQERVIQKIVLEARLNGIDLTDKEKNSFIEHLNKLDKCKSDYKEKLQKASKQFSYRIIDWDIVRDFPDDLLQNMSTSEDHLKGPWTVTHHPAVYHKFLQYCPHKDLRYNAWKGYIMRASSFHINFNNTTLVEEIRSSRLNQANSLGFKTFADMAMQTKMAGSVEDVISVLAGLFVKAKEKQSKELKSLTEFAQSNGFKGDLEECDIPFWRRRELQSLLQSKESDLEKYFPFNHVWHELLAFTSNLFGVHFEEVFPDQVRTWHPDVRFFNILDSNGKKMSSFYLDSYKRPNEKLYSPNNSAWVITLKTHCDMANTTPVASLIFNFKQPCPKSGVTLLSMAEVEILFKKFGHALQHLLSTVPYGETSGLKNIEWDAVELCSNFFCNWLHEPSFLQKISKHHESGQPLDKAGIQDVLTGLSHFAGFDMCHQLFLSHFDLKLYSEDTDWRELVGELWPLYMPFDMPKSYSLPCWFETIISDVWAASYYSHVWSKMLAADVFKAFQECEPHELSEVGKRFRNTFLTMGGGYHSADVFRKFRGRDPSHEALNFMFD